tara:strand:- start:32 stop:298 length:267 start_codon:yes stop_codon:yes gene_type:complete
VRLPVKVIPRAPRDEIVGVMTDGTLKVRVAAAPVDGAANRAVQRVLARALSLNLKNVEIVRGETARRKLLRVNGLTAAEVHARLDLIV